MLTNPSSGVVVSQPAGRPTLVARRLGCAECGWLAVAPLPPVLAVWWRTVERWNGTVLTSFGGGLSWCAKSPHDLLDPFTDYVWIQLGVASSTQTPTSFGWFDPFLSREHWGGWALCFSQSTGSIDVGSRSVPHPLVSMKPLSSRLQ